MDENTVIMIIDDNQDDRELCKRFLKSAFANKVQFIEAGSGEIGLQLLEKNKVDCLLLDYSLPGRNGIEILKAIRSTHPNLAVIMLTGQGNEAIAVSVMKAGVQDYIIKSDITSESIHRIVLLAIEQCSLKKKLLLQQENMAIFSRALAHDLKEPIRTIMSFASFIAKDKPSNSDELVDYAERIYQAASNMEALINFVGTYTEISDEKIIRKEICSSNKIISNVLINLEALIREFKAEITVDFIPDLYGNMANLEQVLQKLITNAIVHAKNSTPIIHISSLTTDDEVTVLIEDNGPGIEEKYREIIFAPFKRLSRTKYSGSGLGLAICKKIIESHGGLINYKNANSSRGSIFYFTLPRDDINEAEKNGNLKKDIPEDLNLANILLVDDDPSHIDLTKIYLTRGNKLQFNIFVAKSGEEAITFLEDKNNPPIHLIFLDINMPVMDGFEFLQYRLSHQNLQKSAVAVCSTSDYEKDKLKSKELGAFTYLEKPLTLEVFKKTIKGLKSLKIIEVKGEQKLVTA